MKEEGTLYALETSFTLEKETKEKSECNNTKVGKSGQCSSLESGSLFLFSVFSPSSVQAKQIKFGDTCKHNGLFV